MSDISRLIPLSEPVIVGNEWTYIKECLDTGWVSSVGSFVNRFEEMMAAYVGVPYAVAVTSGTAALHLALIVASVKKGDAVLVPTLTFIAPVNAVRYVGAEPIFFDCDSETTGFDVDSLIYFLQEECEKRADGFTYHKKTGRSVRAIIPVHVFGYPVDMDPLLEICRAYQIVVIEDATESLGSKYRGRKTGQLGDIGCFSFNGNKIITTGGGGMVLTANEAWAKRIRHLSTQAKKDPFTYEHDEVGYNYRLTNVQAAMGVAQLEQLSEFLARKRAIAKRYEELLQGFSQARFLSESPDVISNLWLPPLKVSAKQREPLLQYLNKNSVQARPVWKLIHTAPMYESCPRYGDLQGANEVFNTCINIPFGVNLNDEDLEYVVQQIRNYFNDVHSSEL